MTSNCNSIKFIKTVFLVSVIFAVFQNFAFSEIIQDTVYNFSLDIPEGFELEDQSEDSRSFLFSHPGIPVQFIMKLSVNNEFDSAPLALDSSLTKLSAIYSIDDFYWNNTKCGIAQFSMKLDQSYSGWAVSAPLQAYKSYITLICYAPSAKEDQCSRFLLSIINSLCTNEEYYSYPGLIISYAFPKTGEKNVELNIGGAKINTTIDNSDIEASNFLIEMEYSILVLYANHPMWKEAWQRYYRLIYRDSFGRLDKCISDVLENLIPISVRKNPSNPELYIAQAILSWVQDFDYTRNNSTRNSTDFTALPAAICGDGNDCDSRSLLVCMFMRSMGYESILLVSPEYSHALACVEMNVPGQKYIPDGTNREFIMGETTAKVTWGMIAENQADRSKWIPVYLP